MGIRRTLRLVDQLDRATQRDYPVELVSPWNPDDTLARLVYTELWPGPAGPVTRTEAVSVPAVFRARNLLAGTAGQLPLQALAGDTQTPTPEQPPWLTRTDGAIPPYLRMVWTVDDLLFYGWSCWAVTRGSDGFPLTAGRIPWDLWSFNSEWQVEVDGQPVEASSVVLFPGFHEGVLLAGCNAIRAASRAERAYSRAAANPVPDVELHQSGGAPMTDAEIETARRNYATARTDPNYGGVAYTSEFLEVRTHGQQPEQLLIDARNYAAVAMAQLTNIPATMLDANPAGASLTYETAVGRNQQFLDYGLAPYLATIAGRLSLDDVVPRGQRVAFDVAGFTAPVTPSTAAPALTD